MIPPPPRICGRFTRFTPEALKAERAEWIMARRDEGHRMPAISAALGLSDNYVYEWVASRGLSPPRPTGNYRKCGVIVGSMKRAYRAAPPEVQEAVLAVAAKHSLTLSEATLMIVGEKEKL